MLDLLADLDRKEKRIARMLPPPARRDPSTDAADEPLADFIARVAPEHAPIPWHLRRLVDLLDRAAQVPTLALVSMPPRHGKSVTATTALAWMVCRWPARQNAYVTYQQGLARAQSRKVRRLVRAQGVRLAEDAQRLDDWRTTADGGLSATGINSGLTGRGFNGLILVDDPLAGREEAESILQREKMWETFGSDVFSRLNPGGSIVVCATRWHMDDLIGRLEQIADPRWEVLNLPAVRDPATGAAADEGAPLWPERFDLAKLREIRAVGGEYSWASLYQGHPVPKGGTLFRVPARYTTPALEGARIVLAVDPAGSASTRADHTAAVALAVHGHGAEMVADVLEVLRFQEETAAAAAHLAAFQRRHGGARLVIEGTRDGLAQARALRSIDPRLALAEIAPRGDKFTRAQPVISAFNAGRVRLPLRAAWVGDFIYEAEKFTGVADAHDDQIDALAHAWNAAALDAAPVPEPPDNTQHARWDLVDPRLDDDDA